MLTPPAFLHQPPSLSIFTRSALCTQTHASPLAKQQGVFACLVRIFLAFFQLLLSYYHFSFLSDSPSTPPLWDILGQAACSITSSCLPSSPTSHSYPYHQMNNTYLKLVAPAEETGERWVQALLINSQICFLVCMWSVTRDLCAHSFSSSALQMFTISPHQIQAEVSLLQSSQCVTYMAIVSNYVECPSFSERSPESEFTPAIPNACSYVIYVISPECIVPSCEPSHIQLFWWIF